MYPGDLYSGAENVANCRCWLRYTNRRPERLGQKQTVFNIPDTSYMNSQNKPIDNVNNVSGIRKPIETIKTSILNSAKKVTSKIKSIGGKLKGSFRKQNINSKSYDHKGKQQKRKLKPSFKKDKTKSVTVDGRTVYGVGESLKDKINFEKEYGININELTPEEYDFIKLYSGDGFTLLNNYLREITNETNLIRLKVIKRKYSIKWLKLLFKYPKFFLSFDKSLKIMNTIFKKGKPLKDDLVVVRRQKTPMTNYAKNGVYHLDSCLSTSISKNVNPNEYGDYVNFIVIPKGTKILYIEGVTSTPNEYEILLDKNCDLKFIQNKSKFETHWKMI